MIWRRVGIALVWTVLVGAVIVTGVLNIMRASEGKKPAGERISGPTLLPPVPGATSRAVTQSNLHQTVCVRGWTSTIRPPLAYTEPLKRRLLAAGGLPGRVSDYQLDHLVSLSLGGAPRSTRNLWMQPRRQAARDDDLEFGWYKQVCAGSLTLRGAQAAERRYKRSHG